MCDWKFLLAKLQTNKMRPIFKPKQVVIVKLKGRKRLPFSVTHLHVTFPLYKYPLSSDTFKTLENDVCTKCCVRQEFIYIYIMFI